MKMRELAIALQLIIFSGHLISSRLDPEATVSDEVKLRPDYEILQHFI